MTPHTLFSQFTCIYVARCDGCLHGVCVAPSRCTCDSGWLGTNCDKQPKKESSSWGISTAYLPSFIPLTYPLSSFWDSICCAGGCVCLRRRCNHCSRNSGLVLLEKETPPRRLWARAVSRVGARWEPRRVIYQGSLTVTVCLQCFFGFVVDKDIYSLLSRNILLVGSNSKAGRTTSSIQKQING